MELFILKEKAFWVIRCHEERLYSLWALGKELLGGRGQPDVRKNLRAKGDL